MARPRRAPDDNGRRIVGPQSALTNYLASHNISARQIEQDFQERRAEALRRAAEEEEQRRQENGEPRADGFGTPSLNATPRRASVRIAGTVGATTASAIEPETTVTVEVGASGGGDQLSAREVLDQIKQKKKGRKKKKRRVDSDDEEEDTLLALGVAAAAALPGQMDNCASCGKRFTVTPYSRADTTGRLLCTTCSKKQDEEEAAARGNKGAKRARGGGRGGRGGAVGQRRKAQSRILDGASPVGAKTLVTLCVEHLSRNIHLADDLGDLPEVMLDRIGRMLAKRRLLNTRTLQLFMRPEAEAVSVYDGALLGMDDYIGMLQAMPRLRRVVVHNAIQFRDDVMRYLMERDVRLETLSLYGANLLSEGMWSEFLRTRGVWLRTLQVCYTDKHITDLVLQCVRDYAPGLQRLKINGNQALGPAGVGAIGGLPVLQHLGLDLSSPVRADVLVRLITDVGGRLQTLSLRRVTGADNTVLAALHDHCRSLRKLRLTENCRFTDAGFVRLFEGWANEPLRFVDFERCRHDDPDQPRDNSDLIGLCSDGFRALMAHSGAALRHLNLCACRHIEHEAFEDVFAADKVYPELTHIEVSFCEEITDGIVCSMFRCCPNLRDVVTFGCMRVTGVQVPYGRIVVGVPNALGMQIFGQDDE